VDLLHRFGATVDTALSNEQALALLKSARYDLVITDVGRDQEGPLAGIDLAEAVHRDTNQQVVFTRVFNPATVPHFSAEDRLVMVKRVQQSVFGTTSRIDEDLHYVLDLLERR
jgi:DNA-binding NarL/FixJ family response regulator